MSECLYEVVEPGIGLITFNRPDRLNAWTGQLGIEYFGHIDSAVADPRVRVIVVTGAGRGYCAGADMSELSGESGQQGSSGPSIIDGRMQHEITTIPKPVIAAVNGAAAGVGMVQALMCDMRFASDQAKFTTAFSKRGLIAEYGMSWILPRLVGHSAAMDLLFSSRLVDAEEALQLGLVDRVVPAAELLDRTMEYATRLALDVSPTSMSVMKRQVWADTGKSLAIASDDALALMRESVLRPDFREGVVSFLKKRQPEFPPVDPGA